MIHNAPWFHSNLILKDKFCLKLQLDSNLHIKALRERKFSEYLSEFPAENRKRYFPEGWYVMDKYSS